MHALVLAESLPEKVKDVVGVSCRLTTAYPHTDLAHVHFLAKKALVALLTFDN